MSKLVCDKCATRRTCGSCAHKNPNDDTCERILTLVCPQSGDPFVPPVVSDRFGCVLYERLEWPTQ